MGNRMMENRLNFRFLSLTTIVLLAAALLQSGCHQGDAARRESSRLTREGNAALEAGQWEEAVRCYTEALARNPRNTDALYGRSSARLVTGKEYYLLARAAAGEGESVHAREIASKADRDFALAAEDAAALLKIDAESSGACYILGCVALYQADWQGALDAFSETIRRAPEMADAYQRRGEVYGFINDLENESADLKRAAELGYTPEEETDSFGDEPSQTAEAETGRVLY